MKTVYLGRFQPFHKGHKNVVEKYREEKDLKIAIGSTDKKREQENPLSFEERKEIIHSCFPDLQIIGIEDEGKTEEGNRKWAKKIERKTGAEALITRNDLVKRLITEHTDIQVIEPEKIGPDSYSGSEVRRRIQSGEEWRYLVPNCCQKQIKKYSNIIKKSGIEYEFEPGWKKENAYHGTED